MVLLNVSHDRCRSFTMALSRQLATSRQAAVRAFVSTPPPVLCPWQSRAGSFVLQQSEVRSHRNRDCSWLQAAATFQPERGHAAGLCPLADKPCQAAAENLGFPARRRVSATSHRLQRRDEGGDSRNPGRTVPQRCPAARTL